jgi:hypothetical protein
MSFVNSNKYLYGLMLVVIVILGVVFVKYQPTAVVTTSVVQADGEEVEEEVFPVDQYDVTPASLEKALRDSGDPVYYD